MSTSTRESATTATGRRVAIVAALKEELSPLSERLREPVAGRSGSLRVTEGGLGVGQVVLAATGDGERAAEKGVACLLSHHEVDALFVLGVAGGLDPGLQAGTVVAARSVRNGKGAVGEPDRWWLTRALRQRETVAGTVVSSGEIAVDPEAKSRLRREMALAEPAVVDLESATYAREAVARNIPFLVLRAVSDTAEETLPLDFNRFRDADGGIDRRRLKRHLILHPGLLPQLLALRERVQECARRLAVVAEAVLCD